MASGLEERFRTLHQVVKAARMNLAPGPWDYLIGGTETEMTLRLNRQALDAIGFRPRVLRDVSKIDCTSTLFDRPVRIPVLLAPIGGLDYFDPGGAATAAKASEEFGVPLMLSSVCQPGFEATAAAAENFRMLQLYVRGDDAWVEETVMRAVNCGYGAIALTVDAAHYSRRERDLCHNFVKPWRQPLIRLEGYQSAFTWENVKRLKDKLQVPLILKGISVAEDAAKAVELGIEGIYVSNHGGRQLDHCLSSVEALMEVVAAVKGRATIIYDGAVNRGTDVVKALALGADAVGIGRLECWGLAAAGQAGLVRVLELLEEEIQITLGLLGVRSWSELDKSYVQSSAPLMAPVHATSAFPLLDLDDEGY
jgi:glycolate oxidase